MPSFTLQTLETMCWARVDNNQVLYTQAEVDYIINECLRTVNLFTAFYRVTSHLPGYTVANQLVYPVPPGILVPIVMFFEGRQLQKTSLKALARQRRNWATDTTAAKGRVDYWAPVGIGMFVISPIDSQGGRDIIMTGLGEPPPLVNPGDVIVLENEYVETITEYAAHRLPLKVGGKLFADGSIALTEFYSKMKQRGRYEGLETPKYRLLDVQQGASGAA